MDWQNFLLGLLTSAAAGTLLTATLAFLLRSWITERLKGAIRHEYDAKIEQLKADLKSQGDQHLTLMKAEIDRQAEKLRIAAASFSEVQKATIARKIEAVDHLWNAVRRARGKVPGLITLTDVLTDEELADLSKSSQIRDMARALLALKPADLVPELFDDADKARPHVGEFTWALFSTYHGILSRVIFLVCGTKPNSDRRWHRDASILRLISSAFGPSKLTEFELLQFQRLSWLQVQFERELFAAFDSLLTGKSFSAAALRQAVEMELLVAKVQAEQATASQPPTL